MNPSIELLRIEFLGVTVRHEEVPLDRAGLALHFVDIGERHGLSRMDLADGGAVFSGADGAELAIRPGQIGSCGVTNLGYREGAERIVGALEETVTRFGVGRMWAEDITLVAVWDLGDPELARSLLVDDILRVDEQRLELLGGDDVTLGLRIWKRQGESSLECAIEPMHSEPGKVYLRLMLADGEPQADIASLTEL
ncbi:MAG TPA: hypothetical protein PKA95_16045, partial [Thermomicrobiales bacterium]|nr:hypothetical protein [Thermomicrobiales bacterium]